MIDWSHITELEDQLGLDGVIEIIDLFVEETSPIVSNLQSTGPQTLRDLHFIRGSASNLGLRQLVHICLVAEQEVRDGQHFDSTFLKQSFDTSCAALASRYKTAA